MIQEAKARAGYAWVDTLSDHSQDELHVYVSVVFIACGSRDSQMDVRRPFRFKAVYSSSSIMYCKERKTIRKLVGENEHGILFTSHMLEA